MLLGFGKVGKAEKDLKMNWHVWSLIWFHYWVKLNTVIKRFSERFPLSSGDTVAGWEATKNLLFILSNK